jgi:hypothetical protein
LSTNKPPQPSPLARLLSGSKTWWVLPLALGLLLTAAVLMVTDFYPELQRFYSVF